MRPVASVAAATTVATCSGSRTSAAVKRAARSGRSDPVTGSSGGRRAHTTTSAPWSKKTSAVARPRPAVPPVTITVRPVMSNG